MREFNLKTYISNLCDSGAYTREYLSQFAGYKKPSGFIKWLNNADAEITNFKDLITLVKKIEPDKTCEFLAKYSTSVSPTHATAKMLLEYLSCNRELEYMKLLIERMESSSSKSAIEWAKVYKLQYEWQSNYYNIDKNAHMKNIKKIITEDKNLKCLLLLMQCHSYYRKEDYKMAHDLSQELILDIESLKEGYFKDSLTAKVHEVYAYTNLYVKNNPEESRKSSELILQANIGKTFNASANFHIGYSYFYSSYDLSEKYLLKSIENYNEIGRHDAADDIKTEYEKLQIFWGVKDDNEKFLNIRNRLLYKTMNNEDISNLLHIAEKEVEVDGIRNGELSFFKGKSEGNKDLMTVGMIEMIQEGNTFEALIMYFELVKAGVSKLVLDSMINFHK